MKKIAFISGISGQDGAYLANHLLKKGYIVHGGLRRSARLKANERLSALKIVDKIKFHDFELLESSSINEIVKKLKPDYFFNLAAQSFVKQSFSMPTFTSKVTGFAVIDILEAIRQFSPKTKFYQASSSEMFGEVLEVPQNEETPFNPRSPYGVAKVFAHQIVKNYRESYGLFCCSGILFNHESPLRGEEFVTKKIVKHLVEIKKGTRKYLELGNLDAKRDWGYAYDYVVAMEKILNNKIAKDYVVATGKTYSVLEFLNLTLNQLNIQGTWKGKGLNKVFIDKESNKKIIKISKKYYRPAEVDLLIGDPSKIKKDLKWRSETNLKNLIKKMIDFEQNMELNI